MTSGWQSDVIKLTYTEANQVILVIIITRLNKLYDYVLALKMALDADDITPPVKLRS